MALPASLQTRLEALKQRYEELQEARANPRIVEDREGWIKIEREFGEIEPVVAKFDEYLSLETALAEAKELSEDEDAEVRELAAEEAESVSEKLETCFDELRVLLLPKDPNEEANVFLEVRAGTGGEEAALFAGDLYRMYFRFAEQRGWNTEIVNERGGAYGGFKEVIVRVAGKAAYSQLKFESGTHRVQRIPETEAQGRIHTSACTIAVLPEVEEIEEVEIDPSELRFDTYRASGAGGQHVNKKDTAVRITHLPTGTVVECQDERSQLQNRQRAMALLRARLLDAERQKSQQEQDEARRAYVGSGDRSERIRTYNFPQNRVTDHRINLTLYRLEELLEGRLELLIEPLQAEHQAKLLGSFGDE